MNATNFQMTLFLGMCLLMSACATIIGKPHIVEVTSTLHTQAVTPQDEELFMVDRASRINFAAYPVSSERRAEEFDCRWTGNGIHSVKFEYRQINRPEQVFSQTQTSPNQQRARFRVAGKDFLNGGAVSAWRITLWDKTGVCIAEKHSVLW